jgi:hypothetical protein
MKGCEMGLRKSSLGRQKEQDDGVVCRCQALVDSGEPASNDMALAFLGRESLSLMSRLLPGSKGYTHTHKAVIESFELLLLS